MEKIEINLINKYKELQNSITCNSLIFFAKLKDKIYICDNKDEVKIRDFENYNSNQQELLIQKVFIKTKPNVIAILNNDNINNIKDKGKIPLMLDDFSEVFGGEIHFVEQNKKIYKYLSKKRAVLSTEKGAIIRARSIDESVTMLKILDKNAFVLSKVGKFVPLSKCVSFLENYVFTNYYSKENQIRQWKLETENINNEVINEDLDKIEDENIKLVLKIAKKIYSRNSTQGTWGNVAVKIDNKTLYCTPKGMGYNIITSKDIVKMDYTTRKQLSNGIATSEKGIHCRIMNEIKNAKISLHAHPIYGSIFAARNQNLKVQTERGRTLLGNVVYCGKHALPMTKALTDNTVDNLCGGNAVFMGNHGITVWGRNEEEIFEIIDVLEKECYLATLDD